MFTGQTKMACSMKDEQDVSHDKFGNN